MHASFFCLVFVSAWSCTVLAAETLSAGTEFFISPDGSAQGDGTKAAPLDLATALSAKGRVKPGATIWLGSGTYRGGFKCTLEGTEAAPITVRGEKGARVTIDCGPRDEKDSGLFTVNGAWTVFRDLEFLCSDEKRETALTGSWPRDIRRGGIDARGANLKFINLVVHDLSNGFGFWGKDATEAGGEIYGCLIYYNGWRGPDRGHGHGIYTQNAAGTKRIVDNIIFDQFGSGVQAYGSEKAALRGFHIEGNIFFNNGSLTGRGQRGTDLLVGGSTPLEGITVLRNSTFGGAGVRFGYGWGGANKTVQVRENFFGGPVQVTHVEAPVFQENTIVTGGTMAILDLPPAGLTAKEGWRENRYFRTKKEYAPFNVTENKRGRGLSFAEWQSQIGLDTGSRYTEGAPVGTRVFVRPNVYEKGRGHIAVYNWEGAEPVEVDLKEALTMGQRYRVMNARNFYGEPALRGVYEGKAIRFPMGAAGVSKPVGMPDVELGAEAPTFGAFVVVPE